MDSSALDYAGFLGKLIELQDENVDASIRGADGSPPLITYVGGILKTGELYGGSIVGYHSDALNVYVGDTSFTLHPDHFRQAVWTREENAQTLRAVFGSVELGFRAGL